MNVTSKNATSPRSCSAISTAGRNPNSKNSVITSVRSLASTQRRTASTNNVLLLQNASKKPLHPKSSFSNSTSRNSVGQKLRNQSETNVCYCSDCATVVDVPEHYLRELKEQLQDLKTELCREKNNNQLLKRDILIAKKVVENEIGVKNEDFYNLINKASDESWKGRREMIIDLKQELRDLGESVERFEGIGKAIVSRKMSKRDESPDIITDDRKIHWCLELERQEVWKNAERYKQQVIASRDSLRNKLESRISKNEKWMKEACDIRKQLSVTPYQIQEGLMERVHNLEYKLKTSLDEKTEQRKKLDDLAQQICRNLKTSVELKSQLLTETLALKEKESMAKSLKEDETDICAVYEEVMKKKCTLTARMKTKLDAVEQNYGNISEKAEQLLKQIADNKHLQGHVKTLQSKISSISLIRSCLSSCIDQKKNELASDEVDNSKVEILGDSIVRAFERKQLKYLSIFQILERRNEDKLQHFCSLINKTKEDVFEFLRSRYLLWKSTSDISVLKNRAKKFRKAVLYPSKMKLVKRKNSSQQTMESLDENKINLEIRISECKCLKLLIRRVFVSKEDDPDLHKIFLTRNQDRFLKELQTIRLE